MNNQSVNNRDKDIIIKELEEELANARRQLDERRTEREQLGEWLIDREKLMHSNEMQLAKLNIVVQATKIGLWEMEIVLDDIVNPANAFNWSDEFRKMLGFTDENDFPNVLGSWIDRLHPEDKEKTIKHAENHILDSTGNTPYDTEYRLLKKNGEYGYFRAYGGIFHNKQGEPKRIAGSLIDVTEARQKEESLRRAVDESKRAQEIIMHREELLKALNDSAFAILSHSNENFIANSETSLLASLIEGMEIVGRCIDVDCVELWQNEVIDGELHTVLRQYWHTEHGKAVKHGTPTSFPYSITNNWESKFLKGECLSGSVDELLPKDQEFLSDYDVKSVLVMPIFIDNHFWGICCMDDCSKHRSFTEDEINILRSSSLMFANALLRNEMIQSIRDTSVRLEEALVQAAAANKAKSDFLSTMSHEIRTPMNVILGIAEIQLQNKALDDALRGPLEKIQVAGYLLLRIINDILDLSKIESGKLELVADTYEIASLILDTVQLNMLQIGSKLIEVELSVDENLPMLLHGDELRVKQILNNLLTNAIKYTEIGKIAFSITSEPNDSDKDIMLVMRVSDTGIGMSKEQIDILFDKFTRFENTGNRTIEGTGLGMNITLNLVHMMNGDICVESEPGKGSVFTVRIPQGKVDCNALGHELSESLSKIQPTGRSQMKREQISLDPMPYGSVLVVDDVETNVYVANGLLMPYDLNIDTAHSGFQAVEKIKRGSAYDIIFMDHMMPNMDGIEATKIIREMGYNGAIVALTANAVKGQADLFLKNGFDDFIPKPIDIRQLNSILNKLIRDKQPQEVVEEARRKAARAKCQPSAVEAKAFVDSRIVEAFVRDAKKTIAILENIITKQDPLTDEDKHLYDVYTHGMKSALLHIGNSELSAVAYKLETEGRDGDIRLLTSVTADFIESLKAQVDALTQKDTGCVNDTSIDNKPYLKEKLFIIKEACSNYDVNTAYDTLELLSPEPWSVPTRDLLSAIEKLLISSDFDEIVSVVDRYLSGV